jgi:glycosyltransferase involved in cell wall biosynthesis
VTGSSLDLALVHDLPPGGGAYRVLAEYVARRPEHRFTVYTPRPATTSGLVGLPDRVTVRRLEGWAPAGPAAHWLLLAGLPRRGQALAHMVDEGQHDAALVFPTELIGASEVLPALETPSVVYVPEPLRLAYEPEPDFARPLGFRPALTRTGLNPFEWRRKALDAKHIRSADAVITHSTFTARAIRGAYGIDAEVVLLGVHTADFAPAAVSGRSEPRDRSVLAVGALHPLKGHQDVIRALGTMPNDIRPPLMIIGDRGTIASDLIELAASEAVQLDLRHGVPFAELVQAYGRSGVLAAAQIREPFGLVTLEAMAAGLPVVAVDEGGFRETVQHGVTGLLVPRDPHRLGAALLQVLDHPATFEEMVAEGLRTARDDWSWERTATGYDAILRQVSGR